ncbi:C40 family peptidase [Clostridium frigoris]|uniref:C40 family peptidase n=1 Tax=Clostridium frigoris TaxID=205327 RepID=A0ABS6BR12_9CLOT|nr:C40 family peptidase [Clostridium frigoris]MBU3158789.1 C40 family peptidase [Clostridium frigoris]
MRKRILQLLISIGLTMSVSMSTIAAPLSQQKDSYGIAQKNSDKLEISIETLDFNIENIYSGIDKAKYDIINTQKKIDQTTKDILVAQNNIKGEETLFNDRMRVMYMNGAESYVEILLDSNGVGDFISRVENIKNIVEYDNKIIKELNDKKEAIEATKKVLSNNKIKVLALKVDNENKLDKLSAEKKVQTKLIVESKKQQELHKNGLAQTSKYEVAMNTQSVKQITPSRGNLVRDIVKTEPSNKESTSTSSNAIIAYAKTFLGTPYAWGANGPNTFDCSGFTKYVYAHFGIGMGRTTYDQITQGKYVSRENLQAGDLVFFGTGSPHHVGIYVGNGSYIHAPQTGDVVKISQMTRNDYMSARRFK